MAGEHAEGIAEAAQAFMNVDGDGRSVAKPSGGSQEVREVEVMDFGGFQDIEGEPNDNEDSDDDSDDGEAGDRDGGDSNSGDDDSSEDGLTAEEIAAIKDAEDGGKKADKDGVRILDPSQLDDNVLTKVTIDGEEKEIPLKEALNGYIRQETFHQRLNQIHEARTILEREQGEAAKTRTQYAERLDTLLSQLSAMEPKEPDWDALYAQDPQAARAQQKQWENYKTQKKAIEDEQSRVKKEQTDEEVARTKVYVERETQMMLDQHPEWKADPKAFERDSASMARTAKAAGFSDQEIAQVYDHRMVAILDKAARYDRMMARRPKPVNDSRQVVKPGAGSRGTAPKGVATAQKRLARTGTIEAAADVFKGILSR